MTNTNKRERCEIEECGIWRISDSRFCEGHTYGYYYGHSVRVMPTQSRKPRYSADGVE